MTNVSQNKGGRPPTGRPRWNKRQQRWEARVWVTGEDGAKHEKTVPLANVAQFDREKARALAAVVARRNADGGMVTEGTPETVNEWTERWLKDRDAKGLATVGHDRSRLKLHVLPSIGTTPMIDVRRDQLEALVEDLDARILRPVNDERHISWKTAANTWTIVTKMFDDATSSKRRDLRVRVDNPVHGVRGPERGVKKAKQYLYPSEFLRLVSAPVAKVPTKFRTLYAAAVYLFARAGELEALTWDDVDLEHGVIHITKAIDRKTGEVKSTKSGETRRLPIEANLAPLLQRLKAERPKGAKGSERVLWLPDDEDRAIMLREHLLAAGVTRAELQITDAQRKNLTFHDLRATGITWMAVRGDDPLRIKQRAGHSSFHTTEGYIREAENLVHGFGEPFPELPIDLTGGFGIGFQGFGVPATPPGAGNPSDSSWSKGGSNP